jgi:hypothetical protein
MTRNGFSHRKELENEWQTIRQGRPTNKQERSTTGSQDEEARSALPLSPSGMLPAAREAVGPTGDAKGPATCLVQATGADEEVRRADQTGANGIREGGEERPRVERSGEKDRDRQQTPEGSARMPVVQAKNPQGSTESDDPTVAFEAPRHVAGRPRKYMDVTAWMRAYGRRRRG